MSAPGWAQDLHRRELFWIEPSRPWWNLFPDLSLSPLLLTGTTQAWFVTLPCLRLLTDCVSRTWLWSLRSSGMECIACAWLLVGLFLGSSLAFAAPQHPELGLFSFHTAPPSIPYSVTFMNPHKIVSWTLGWSSNPISRGLRGWLKGPTVNKLCCLT